MDTVTPTRPSGFTLIELLLYVTIVGTLLIGVSVFFALSADARIKNQTINQVDQQGTFAMDVIAHTIRNGTAITSPAAGATGSSLTLTVPTGSLSPTIFDLSGGVLRIKEGTGTAVSLTSSLMSVSNLTIKNLTRSGTPGIVQVSFTINRVNPNNKNEYDYSKTFTTSAGVRP